MISEANCCGHPRQGLAAHEMGEPPGQHSFGFIRNASPQHLSDNHTKHPITKKFEAFITVLNGFDPAPASPLGGERARMSERLGQQHRRSKLMPDELLQIPWRRLRGYKTSGIAGR